MNMRLKITGIGAVSAVGGSSEALWRAMVGESPAPHAVDDDKLIAPVREMYLADDRPVLQHSAAEFGVRAAREALDMAVSGGFDLKSTRLALIVGTGMGEATRLDVERATMTNADSHMFATAAEIADALGVTGAVMSTSNACAASAYAVASAADLILTGRADAVLVVGAEAYSRVAMGSFNRMLALDPRGCRAFADDRAGTLFGEGAAALVLEREASAVTEVAWLRAAELSCDAGHVTAPSESGADIRRAFEDAVNSAGVPGVGVVIPHGTGTQLNDQVEAKMLRDVAPGAIWFSLKPLIGHTGGASAALAVVVACLIAVHGSVPANRRIGDVMEAASTALGMTPRGYEGAIAVNAYAFGGSNATLLVEGAL